MNGKYLHAVDKYTKHLASKFDQWVGAIHPTRPVASPTALAARLVSDVEEDQKDYFILAFLLGFGASFSTLSSNLSLSIPVISDYLTQSSYYLSAYESDLAYHLSLHPDPPFPIAQFRHRLTLYSQPFWSLINEGVLHRLSVTPAIRSYQIERILDDAADHCATCPSKAGIYSSVTAYLDACGGVPGSIESNDDCGPNCRCYLRIIPPPSVTSLASQIHL